MIFRYADIAEGTVNGIGLSLEIWFQGCNILCEQCQNPGLQPIHCGTVATTGLVIDHWNKHNSFYDSIVFLGGEPTCQPIALYEIITNITDKPKILYTGLEWEAIPLNIRNNVDIVVCGPYKWKLQVDNFPASSNQRIFVNGQQTNTDFRKNY